METPDKHRGSSNFLKQLTEIDELFKTDNKIADLID